MAKGSPPPAPDYIGAAQQQGQDNLNATRASAQLNNPNVIGPTGTQTVSYGSGFNQAGYDQAMAAYQARVAGGTDFGVGGLLGGQNFGYGNNVQAPNRADFTTNADTPTITQTLSPEQQKLYDQGVGTQYKLGMLAGKGADALNGVVGTPLDFSGAPQTGSYDDTRKQVYDASMARANEDYGKQKDQSNSDLIAAGIRPGSKAYGDQAQMLQRGLNDASAQAQINAGNAASQAYGMDADRRKQYITEQLAERQTPINEISALMSGSQVSNPFQTPGYSASANAQPAPSMQAQGLLGGYNTDVYNAGVQQKNTNISTGVSVAMAAAMAM